MRWRHGVCWALIAIATAGDAFAESQFETTTSITTYVTRHGVKRDAPPAFRLRTADTPDADALALRIANAARDDSVDVSSLRTKVGENDVALERAPLIGVAGKHQIVKIAGAAVVGTYMGVGAGLFYAVGAAVTGAFKPLEKIIEREAAKDEFAAKHALKLQVYVIDRQGKVTPSDLRPLASNRSGYGDLLHYIVRDIRTPSSPREWSGYMIGESVSFLFGEAVPTKSLIADAAVETVGDFIGSLVEQHLVESSSSGSVGNYTTMVVPDGRGGMRVMSLPTPSLTPSIAATTIAPKLTVQTIRPLEVPPFAVEPAVTTLRGYGASSVFVAPVAEEVVIVRPDYFAESATTPTGTTEPLPPDADAGPVDDHHIENLPSSIEIHGLGSFSINR
jgi:hypothetical protein